MQRLLILCLTALALLPGCSGRTQYRADAPEIEYVGRTQAAADGSVSFDWSGTYLYCRFTGGCLAMRVSDTGRNYYNLSIDGKPQPRPIVTEGRDSLIVLAKDLSYGEHLVCLQKRTEGEQGRTTIHAFELSSGGELLPAAARRERLIEFIGDSLTCGFGTEGASKDDPFLPQTENCNYAYACMLARLFDADYTLIAHSGRGLVRNYADPQPVSAGGTLNHRVGNLFDECDSIPWNYAAARRPDAVVVNLGSNDFSTQPNPSAEQFTAGYQRLVEHLRRVYGDVPVVCVAPRVNDEVLQYIREFVRRSGDKRLYVAAFMQDYCNGSSDLGSCGHPNREGQRKMAMLIAPYLSTATGWEIPCRAVE